MHSELLNGQQIVMAGKVDHLNTKDGACAIALDPLDRHTIAHPVVDFFVTLDERLGTIERQPGYCIVSLRAADIEVEPFDGIPKAIFQYNFGIFITATFHTARGDKSRFDTCESKAF
ncbi:hypothetical protein PSYPI_02272 [Pseudomonas syringae pv. pisi str. 1704B]|uniref:Uncharacterized protein n=1 Tax=Pseudomonas syringae pv. pisi str. 1704B TaxID=629263 RepID=F3G2K0_PSESJ|nr:hypothetical protein PSYPI_02272 [Pseudomonas syringae pv. pisi str. 1704B]EGH97775.1 hypothetical protein PLA106_16864 [Pseudomonas amygdali pv. lachrymans str. M302278]